MKKWVVEIDGDKFLFKLFIDGKVNEQYGPVEKDKAFIYASAIIAGFDPPKILSLHK